jgi:putative effector of murein hydrolase
MDEQERTERQMAELLQELRVALPGVQILFAFLLIVPFNNRFERVTELQKDVYFIALLAALASITCLIAPTAFHRIRFRDYDKEALVLSGTWLARVGLVFLAVSLTACAFFVTDFIFDATTATVVAVAFGLALVGLWFAFPIAREVDD